MDLWRISFKPMTEGGDDVTGALRKADLNFETLDDALGDAGVVGGRVVALEKAVAGLGDASVRNIGSTAGTVAAGDDARIVAVGAKADKASVDSALATKADKSYVDAGLGQRMYGQSPVFTGAIGKHGIYGENCFYVSNATAEGGIGGSYVDWAASRTAAMQIDAMSNQSAYMGIRWTHWGVKHLAGIDVYEGGGLPGSMTSLSFHFDTGTNKHAFFSNGSATFAGALTQNSDYRIKSDIVSIDPQMAARALRQSHPIEYRDTRHDEGARRVPGFIAHELQEGFPLVVDGEKDATRIEKVMVGDTTPYLPGEAPETWSTPRLEDRVVPQLQNVNYIGLVPYLCAGWQQLDERLRSIEQQLATVLGTVKTSEE